MADYAETDGGTTDPLQETYKQILQEHALSSIVVYEQLWKQEANKSPPDLRFIFDHHLSSLKSLRIHVPQIAVEGARFQRTVDKAQYGDVLDELDAELARREHIFGKILIGTIVENWRFVRLERAKGRVRDLEDAVRTDQISGLFLSSFQLAGTKGYLTEPREVRVFADNSFSTIANALAYEAWRASQSIRRKVVRLLILFYLRYALDAIRRQYLRVFVSLGLAGLGMGYFIEVGELRVWGLGGALIICGAVGVWIFERVGKSRWLNIHRRAIRSAATNVYSSFLIFVVEYAYLDSIYKLGSKTGKSN